MSSGWEFWLLRFLELSGVGRVVENGEDEDERQAASWIVWEGRGGFWLNLQLSIPCGPITY